LRAAITSGREIPKIRWRTLPTAWPASGCAIATWRGGNMLATRVNETGTGRRIARRRSKRLIAFGRYGGKFSHLDFLLPIIPTDAVHFCDVFGGSAAVLLNIEPYAVETYNDLDSGLVNFFATLRNQNGKLIKAIALTQSPARNWSTPARRQKGCPNWSGRDGSTFALASRGRAWHRPAVRGGGRIAF